MSDNVTLGEVFRLVQRIEEKIDGLTETVHGHDIELAKMKVLATRSGQKWGASAGGFVGGLVAALYGLIRQS